MNTGSKKYKITKAVQLMSVPRDPLHCIISTGVIFGEGADNVKKVDSQRNWVKLTMKDGRKFRARTPPEVATMLRQFDETHRPQLIKDFTLDWCEVVTIPRQPCDEPTAARMEAMRATKAARAPREKQKGIKVRVDGITRITPLQKVSV